MYVQFLFAVPIMYSVLDSISVVNMLYINTVQHTVQHTIATKTSIVCI